MTPKSLIILSLIAVCVAEPPTHPHSPTKSNQAVFSQSVTREDVPLSYQYTAYHTYTTPSAAPLKENTNYQQSNNHYLNYPQNDFAKQPLKQIQYAPVTLESRAEEPVGTKQQLYTKVIVNKPILPATEKVNLEYVTKNNDPDYFNKNVYKHAPQQTYWNPRVDQPVEHHSTIINKAYPTIDSSYSNLKYVQNNQYPSKTKEIHTLPKPNLPAPIRIVYAKSIESGMDYHKVMDPNNEFFKLNGHKIVGPIKRVNIGGSEGLVFAIKPRLKTPTNPQYNLKIVQSTPNYEYLTATESSYRYL